MGVIQIGKVAQNPCLTRAEGEDDVDDRTDNHRHRHTDEAETEESLIAKWKQYHREYVKHETSVLRATDKAHALEQQAKTLDDEEERFFLQNDLDLNNDIRNKSSARQDEIKFEIEETEKLLRIVNRTIITDFSTGYIGTQALPAPTASEEIQKPLPQCGHQYPPSQCLRPRSRNRYFHRHWLVQRR
jgi:glutamate synthase domain-containing protein 2